MLTEEQQKKAKEALCCQSVLLDFEKKIAFWNQQEAVAMVHDYNLPYRVALNYIKAWTRQDGLVRINPCYPFPGYRVDDLIHLRPDEYMLHDPTKPPREDGTYELCLTPIKAETRARIKDLCYKLRTWNLDTKQGIKQWEFEFAHFLNAADFDNYTSFDYWGSKQEPKDAESKINYWKKLQADYRKNPSKYRQEEPPCLPGYATDYTALEFIPEKEDCFNDGM